MDARPDQVVLPLGRDVVGEWRRAIGGAARRTLRDPQLLIGSIGLGILVFLAVFGPVFWARDATLANLDLQFRSPSWAHPMGTDSLGRDVFARFNEGAQISLAVGAIVVVLGTVAGTLIGVVGGTFGGIVDTVLMRLMDAILAFPPLILAMAVTVGLGSGLETATLGIMITTIPYYARLVRADVLRVRSLNFVEAATALGATRWTTIRRHILPHLVSTISVQSTSVFGFAVLQVAALGFVGLGAQIPTPEWGAMITEGLDNVLTGGWWVGVFPGIGLLIAVAATSILADRIRDILDPRGEHIKVT